MLQSRDTTVALAIFRRQGGVLKTQQALDLGIHPAALYELRDTGRIIPLARGLYRLAGAREFSNPDLVFAATKAPTAVVCLVSALAFHEITTQVPRVVHLAVPQHAYSRLRFGRPPVRVFRYDPKTFDQGMAVHSIDGVPVRIYSVARTLVDCFKFRNKIGLDIAIEALKFARERKRISNREILHVARLLRQENVMGPYLDMAS